MIEYTPELETKLHTAAQGVRKDIIEMLTEAGSGHPGGSLGMADVFVALYYGGFLRHRPDDPAWAERDRLVLSNGHICPVLYACLADQGYFPKSWLSRLRKTGAELQGHPSMTKTPGIEASTGSLGHGFSMAVGMAIACRLDKKDNRIFSLLGDGECQEGLIWEAAMSAVHYKLDNLIAIVDRNDAQIDGTTEDVMSLEPFADKWRAFGWKVIECDGHSFQSLFEALNQALEHQGKPVVLIAKTLMGKGVQFMEADGYKWHGKAPSKEQADQALKELAKTS